MTKELKTAEVLERLDGLTAEIGEDSTNLRNTLEEINQYLSDYFLNRSGVKWGDDEKYWNVATEDETRFGEVPRRRLGIRKTDNGWRVVLEWTYASPRHWNGQNWIGSVMPFEEPDSGFCAIEEAQRKSFTYIIWTLVPFLGRYTEHLEYKKIEYKRLKKKVEDMKAKVGT